MATLIASNSMRRCAVAVCAPDLIAGSESGLALFISGLHSAMRCQKRPITKDKSSKQRENDKTIRSTIGLTLFLGHQAWQQRAQCTSTRNARIWIAIGPRDLPKMVALNQVPLSAAAQDLVKNGSAFALLADVGGAKCGLRFADQIEEFPNANFRDRPS